MFLIQTSARPLLCQPLVIANRSYLFPPPSTTETDNAAQSTSSKSRCTEGIRARRTRILSSKGLILVGTAFIGGTGIDELSEFSSGKRFEVSTRFGRVELVESVFGNSNVFFLPRHGFGHCVPPSLINYRAQIAGLKKIGVTRIISLSAVGSLTPELKAGSFAVLGDFIDMTKQRQATFFDEPGSPVVHTDFSQPYCPELTGALVEACRTQGVHFIEKAVYVAVEGPRYETPAEVRLFASWGAHVVGMTNVPEVVLAREAGICFAGLAIVANLASGLTECRLAHDEVRGVVAASGKTVAAVLKEAIVLIPTQAKCSCGENAALVV